MHIVELDDQDFGPLLSAFQVAEQVGKCWKDGNIHLVRAHDLFLMVAPSESPEKIAILPARGVGEAKLLAEDFLSKEQEKGNLVEFNLSNQHEDLSAFNISIGPESESPFHE